MVGYSPFFSQMFKSNKAFDVSGAVVTFFGVPSVIYELIYEMIYELKREELLQVNRKGKIQRCARAGCSKEVVMAL